MTSPALRYFQQGRISARQLSSLVSFPRHARCCDPHCGNRPMVMGRCLMPLADYRRANPAFDLAAELMPSLVFEKTVQLMEGGRSKPYVITGVRYACDTHRRVLVKVLASMPSWVVAELWEGPNMTNAVTTGPRGHAPAAGGGLAGG